MTKNISHISSRIVCPKCSRRTMRKSLPEKLDKEFFCDTCHVYFGIAELVNQWNYDVADFYSEVGTQLTEIEWLKVAVLSFSNSLVEVVEQAPDPEGEWSSEISSNESYEVVNRMLMGIEELEWDFDACDLPCPILQTGMC